MNRKIKTAIVSAGLAGVVIATGAASCDKATEAYKDAPRSGEVNTDPAGVADFPDGFTNVSYKCVGTDMVFVGFHGDSKYAAISVVKDDAACKGGG